MIFKNLFLIFKYFVETSAPSARLEGGYLVVLLLVFGAVFFTIFTAFMSFTISQKQVSTVKNAEEQSLQIAEAGLNYYKWFLAHNPDDITNATTSPQPFVIAFDDPEGGEIGEYSLEVDGNLACDEVTSIDITSTGYTYDEPERKRTVYGRYARPNVAEYSHIVNANVWAGDDREIYGPYHSNGFVRMDGTNNSNVTSGQTLDDCGDVDICDPYPTGHGSGTDINGVFGEGPNDDLWQWSVPSIDFDSIAVDVSVMEDKAKNGGGLWFDSSSSGSGYYVVFEADGTMEVRKIKKSKTKGNAYGHAKNFLNSAQLVGTYTVPSDCSLIYFSDDVWVEGVVSGKVTMVAATSDPDDTGPSATVIGNLTYVDEESGFMLLADNDISIGYDVPDNMEINGVFIAQGGRFGRPHYTTSGSHSGGDVISVHWSNDDHIFKDTLTTNGTVVSKGRVGTKWICSSWWSGEYYCSGFEQRYDYYDRDLAIDPPPLTPKTSEDYQFIEWREE